MNELIMPHNVGVKNALENMKEVLALYKKVIGRCFIVRVIWKGFWKAAIILHINDRGKERAVSGSCAGEI